ncbi:MAG: hypothetical protein O8C64_11505 [Candidatus Methanoperedens sp.]|nr:hypothetical protein [Candidatus Methanoperedens sp.]MCZ7405700.1 hypothetical protein [Candidatus Methanoperedens sp.]
MDKNSEELASRLSYEIIKEVAPDELDLFDDIKEEYLKNPDAFQEKDPKKKEKMLGFGTGVGEIFVTTTILPLIWGVIAHIGKAGVESLKKEGAKALEEKIKEKIGGKEVHTSNEKIKELRDYIFKNALSMGMDEQKATFYADSIIGKLTIMGFNEQY